MKNLFYYSILVIGFIIDTVLLFWGAITILKLECSSIERVGAMFLYLVLGLTLIILTSDVVLWVEKQLHD